MKKALLLLLPLLLITPTLASAEEAPSVERLAWLAGCWAGVNGEAGTGEQWMLPAGGTLLGVSRVVHDSETAFHEFMEIRELDDGRVVFIAHPSGQDSASFDATSLTGERVVFENLEHDFPQRIIYFRTDDGNIAARIEGEIDGERKSRDFPMERVACEESAPTGDR